MKVQGPSSSTAAVGARRAGGAIAPGFVLPSDEMGATNGASRLAATANLSNIGALLALQTQDDVAERRRRATRRSNALLDQLDGIRLSILGEGVTREQVAALSNTLREYRDQVDDPGLDAILNDVELRAEVELAKLERAI
jgi:Class II flagellar assembly regulator